MSTDYKCPDCDATRPTRSSMAYHITVAHPSVPAKKVNRLAAATATSPVCMCGDPIQLRHESDPGSWIHVPGSETSCLMAVPKNQELAAEYVAQVSATATGKTQATSTTDLRLEQAGRDIADLKRQLDGLARQINRPDPVQTRNSVLYEVWNQLMDVGETSAARLVRTMWDGS